ncbi:MAG: response regulator [Ectothiorhodospiraceae bacterium]|nr:response regulator [Ectothiorhodospiraceae bacterium]
MTSADSPSTAMSAATTASPDFDGSAFRATEAARHIATRGRVGGLAYVAIWLVICASTELGEETTLALAATVVLGSVGGLRLALALRFERLYPADPQRWRNLYATTVLVLGLVWGTLFAHAMASHPLQWASYMMMLTTAGLAAGGAIGLIADLTVLRAHVVAITVPGAIAAFAIGSVEGAALGCLLLFNTTFLLVIGKQSNREYLTALDNTILLARRAEELELARRSAEQADRAKTRFLANMSHEIRTPMNGVLGMAELLEEETDAEERSRSLTTLKRSARALLGIIDSVLDLSKIEADMLRLEQAPFVPASVVDDVCHLFAANARRGGITIEREICPLADTRAVGDSHRLRQVLTNLTSNAVKFTERGWVRIAVRAVSEDDTALTLRFAVRDTGPGIPRDALARVFDAFEQADTSTTRRHGGTGLGLAISRRLVRLMGGEMRVESTVGEGSEFSFELALPKAAGELPSRPRVPAAAGEADGLRVLVVEDNAVNQLVAGRFLRRLGCDWEAVPSGGPAVEACTRDSYDLVLMDCEMPGMDGFEATRRIRAAERRGGRPRLPVVALTAHAMSEHRERALACGMDDFLTKPFTIEQLCDVLSRNARPREHAPADGESVPRVTAEASA